MDEIAIKVESVSKDFILPHERITSVKGIFTNMLQKATETKERQHALREINFDVKKGEFFGIVGRNGSGKSTLLKILAGIYQPTKGKVSISGKLVPFIELGVGFNPELSGRDNVYLNGAMLGFSVKEIDAIYEDIVSFAELEDFMDQKLKNYSSGMQVRLAFSMATRSEAEVLLVDEVLAVGDADFQRKCFDYFRLLKKHKKTVVFVTHDMNSVREYCDRAILIEQSRIVVNDNARIVAQAYTKMFNDQSSVNQQPIETKRWGNKEAKIVEVKLSKIKILDEDKNITIDIKVTSARDLSDLSINFLIKNGKGVEIMGTDNKMLGRKVDIEKNRKIEISFEVPNIFSEDNYTVDVYLNHDGKTCDYREEVANFNVLKNKKSGYIVSPDIKIKMDS